METHASENSDGVSNGSSVAERSFAVKVYINDVELGRGRGATKAAARQDASRRAMAALVPGVVFDPNGILVDAGSGMGCGESLLRGVNNNSSEREAGLNRGVDELGPHLESQLAIGGHARDRHRPQSPDHSEDSSISTVLSEEVFSGGGALVSGGPLSHHHKLPSPGGASRFSSHIYPCASTTSGVSSASDVDDDDGNAYYSSRGASVCSTLLHAMWQIDFRIREPPSYVFDLCPTSSQSTESNVKRKADADADRAVCSSSKRKKVDSPLTSIPHRTEVTAARLFQCTASLNLYFPKHLVGDRMDRNSSSIMEHWVSPLDYLQSKKESSASAREKSGELSSRKRKDNFTTQSLLSSDRAQYQHNGEAGAKLTARESPKSQHKDHQEGDEEECIRHKLESVGTGSSKRESKHKASAKLLAALFPGCKSNMVEVKAEAEAARELYAANKAAMDQLKRAKFSSVSSREGEGMSKRRNFPPAHLMPQSRNSGAHGNDMKRISLHALSLSEPVEGSKRIKWSSPAANTEPLESEWNFQNEVDEALQSLQETDDEAQRWTSKSEEGDVSFDDIGKVVLRRAFPEDSDCIHFLFNENDEESSQAVATNKSKLSGSLDEADGYISAFPGSDNEDNLAEENNGNAFLREHAILLVLSRTVALHEPPLGCALLKLQCLFPPDDGKRILTLSGIGHKRHLPRERFIECLGAFAKSIRCDLSVKRNFAHITSDDIRPFLLPSFPHRYCAGDTIDRVKGNAASHSNLQSVKEEDSEESSGGEEESDKKIDSRDSGLVKGRPSKPSKRSRVS